MPTTSTSSVVRGVDPERDQGATHEQPVAADAVAERADNLVDAPRGELRVLFHSSTMPDVSPWET